jgi:secondary thiamine-phosphate synthase enzyme
MVITKSIRLSTNGNCDIRDITNDIREQVKSSGLTSGTVTVFVPGSTGGLTTIEYEPGLIADLPELLEKLVPSGVSYQHDRTWHDGNGHAHLRSALIGPDITIPFVAGKLTLGSWQQVIFLDFDNRRRDRELVVQIMGE